MTIRRLTPEDFRRLDDWRPLGRAVTEALHDLWGYSLEDDDGYAVDTLCAAIGIEPDWTVAYLSMVRRFATSCLPERKRPPWRVATYEECWTPRGDAPWL